MLNGHVEIGDGLSLNALCGVDNEQRTLTGSDASRHLVREVDVSRSVDKVQNVCLTIMLILHLDGMTLDGYASLSLQIHVVKHLTFGNLDGFCPLEQPVRQCGFTVVNVCYDAEVAYMFHISVMFVAKLQFSCL